MPLQAVSCEQAHSKDLRALNDSLAAATDIVFTIAPTSATIASVMNGSTALVSGTSYTLAISRKL